METATPEPKRRDESGVAARWDMSAFLSFPFAAAASSREGRPLRLAGGRFPRTSNFCCEPNKGGSGIPREG